MAPVSIPHFSIPFQFGSDGHAVVNEQGSLSDVSNCVEAVLRTERGSRLYVPNFGINDPTFSVYPTDIISIEQQIVANEPRAHLTMQAFASDLDALIETIRVGVMTSGN